MNSIEHINYLKKKKKETFIIILFRILIIFSFLLIWQFLIDKKFINSFIFSSPKLIYKTIIKLYNEKKLLYNIFITLFETTISFCLSFILGITIATILWWNKIVQKILEPYLTILNSLPKVALGPIIIIWFGAGIKSIICMALLISLFITIINIYESFNNTNKNQIKLMKSFNATKLQIFIKLILPSNFKNIINVLKINISMNLIGIIMGEFLISKNGIGYLILYGSQIFDLSLVITGIFILGIVATVMYYFISLIEKFFNKY